MPREESFDTGAVTINYLDEGSPSGEPLVMLHGGAWCWQEYISLIPSLCLRWRTYALDLRGNGASGWVAGEYGLADFAEDNVEFVRRLNLPAVLIGHSVGGVIALMVAERCADKVKAVIIEDSPIDLDIYRKIIVSGREVYRLWLDLKRSARSETELALALADNYRGYPGTTGAWILFFARCLWRLDPTFFDALLYDVDAFLSGYDPKQILASLHCPILFIRGESKLGAVMTDEEIAWVKQNCSQADCAQISGVGHLLHLQEQGQPLVLNEMMTFLDRILVE
jgi:pimeloyl-ACP methyl ester carboxylesterase